MGGTHPKTLERRLVAISKLHFFRDSHGNEVDLLIQRGAQLIPVGIKAEKTWSAPFGRGIVVTRSYLDLAHEIPAMPAPVLLAALRERPERKPSSI